MALDQQITARDELDGTSEKLNGLIRTNADIQPGDSGGPLVNTAGQVIGLDTAASSGYSFGLSQTRQSQGFAIPVDTAAAPVAQIENHTASAGVHIGPTAFLGVELQPAAQGGPSGGSGSSRSGAPIVGVVSGTPAARAGPTAGRHHCLGRRPVGRLAERLDCPDGRLQAGRQGHDRLEQPIGRATHKHRAACLGPADERRDGQQLTSQVGQSMMDW